MLAADFGHTDIIALLCSWRIAPREAAEDEECSEEALVPRRRDVAAALQIAHSKGMRDAEELLASYL